MGNIASFSFMPSGLNAGLESGLPSGGLDTGLESGLPSDGVGLAAQVV